MSETSSGDLRKPSRPSAAPGFTSDSERLDWLRRIYYSLDGRWYLKLRERTDPSFAQEVDEDVCRSIGAAQVRAWRDLTGAASIDDCRTLGQFVRDVLDTLYGDHREVINVLRDEPGCWEMQHIRCAIFEMGQAAGYAEDAVPGKLPGCGGILALAHGWVREAGPFRVAQRPASGPPHGVACRYVFALGAGEPTD